MHLILGKTKAHVRYASRTIGIHIERDVDLGNAAWRGRDASKLELAQQVVIFGAGALTLVHLHAHDGERRIDQIRSCYFRWPAVMLTPVLITYRYIPNPCCCQYRT